ncbi:MAG TPA: glycosyltransferase family 9 protein [Nitrospiria bacterium]|nr:glycosyltransferase family 9 protein [Nitrospiria bacterium]
MRAGPERLLLVKPSSFGDIIHTLPVLDAIHRSWPQTAVDWIVKPEWTPLLEGHPMLREVLSFPMSWQAWRRTVPIVRKRRYDLVLDLQGLLRSGVLTLFTGAPVRIGFANGREGSPWCYSRRINLPAGSVTVSADSPRAPLHAIERYLYLAREAGVSYQGPVRFPLPPWADAERWADRCWDEAGIRPEDRVCVIHPAARWATKRWPADRFALLADRLTEEQGWRVIFVAGAGDRAQATAVTVLTRRPHLDLSGRTTIPQLAALLRRASLMVTNDSGPMHLAVAVGTPVVALFGPTDPRAVGPYGPGQIVLRKSIDCSSCTRQRCVRDLACLNAISVEEVYASVGCSRLRPRHAVSDLDGVTESTIAGGI